MLNIYCSDGCVRPPINRGQSRATFCQKYTVHIVFVIMIIIHVWYEIFVAFPFKKHLGSTVIIISNSLFILAVAYFLATACTDPGIIPPAPDDEAQACIPEFESKKPPLNRIVEVKGQQFSIRYCQTCYMFRPPRVSHCSCCNVCVENFDHHCPYLGNCVGRRNYRRFIYFLIWLTLYNCFLVASSFALFLLNIDDGKRSTGIILFITTIVLCATLYPLAGLTGYHFFLMMASMTTNEDIKDTFLITKEKSFELVENPYSAGSPCMNVWNGLCMPYPPSRLRIKQDLKIKKDAKK